MAGANEHIEDYLDYYLGLATPPEFAVLITGPWGSGKTWVVKNYCERHRDSAKFLHVSLYGVQSHAEIDQLLLEQLYPARGSRQRQLTVRMSKMIAGAASQRFVGAALDGPDVAALFMELLVRSSKHVLIFDDLERCAMAPLDTLGYINRFVEQRRAKAIIIANEDEIASSALTSESGDLDAGAYRRIKEKLIGKTLGVTPEPEQAAVAFIRLLGSEAPESFFRAHLDDLLQAYISSDCSNLRSIRIAILEFARVLRVLAAQHVANADLMRLLFLQFLAYTFEIQKASIRPESIAAIKDNHFHTLAMRALERDDNEDRVASIVSQYPMAELDRPLIPEQLWSTFFAHGIVDHSAINQALSQSRFYYEANTQPWRRLMDLWSLSDEEFRTLLEIVRDEYRRRAFKELGVVKHVTGLFLFLSTHKLIPDKADDIVTVAKKYTDVLRESGQLANEYDEFGRFVDDDHYAGISFWGNGTAEFSEILQYMRKCVGDAYVAALPEAGTELLHLMEGDVGLFVRRLVLSNSKDNLYYNRPVLAHVSPAAFVASLDQAPPDHWRPIFAAIKGRYEHRAIAEHLLSELPWLKEVRALLQQRMDQSTGRLSAFRISNMMDNYIDSAIASLEDLAP